MTLPPVIATELVAELRARVRGEVSDSALRRAEYATDASNYRVPPTVVVFPVDADDLVSVTAVARELGVPLTLRGGGTSVAGNSIGEGVVADLSVHMNKVLAIDPVAMTARVQPGVVMSVLQEAAARHGLRLGPDPSTSNRASIGGMIGNNACGPHALAFGKMSDNVVELDVVDGTGHRFVARDDLSVVPGLDEFVRQNLAVIRKEFGRFGRQVSGYSLEHLLPEQGHSLVRALVGTEGTLVTILEATVSLVRIQPNPYLVVLGYPSMEAAADDVPPLLRHRPQAMEGMDAGLVEVVRRARGVDAVPELPLGAGWLMIEISGADADEARKSADSLVAGSSALASRILPGSDIEAVRLWRLRADGAGLGGRTPGGKQAWPGWEDAAVPPEALGAYLREFRTLMDRYAVDGMVYGHFGDGCVHVRLDLPLEKAPETLRAFTTEAARLVTAHGGSLSGEHGDGRARSELLELMYSREARDAMKRFKSIFDPERGMNPGVIVHPVPLDFQLRRPRALPIAHTDGFAFAEDNGDFTTAVHRCVGVGKCRADNGGAGGFMCPSFQATQDETHVTRGRARVLQELASGGFGKKSWAADEVNDALDLCLSCKACSADCPAGVDMAKYKSEALHRRFRGRIRPITHYVLGWLPRWSRLAGLAPRLVNAIIGFPGISALLLRGGGMDSRRMIPAFAPVPFSRRRKRLVARPSETTRPTVVLWVDSFTGSFSPDAAEAAITVLEDAGYRVVVPQQDECCGLTWISTGQLPAARKRLAHLLEFFSPFVEQGIPIVGLEPSCTAVLRSDLLDLIPDDPRARALAGSTRTLAEILGEAGTRTGTPWAPPSLEGVEAVVQPHCHQYSVTGFGADAELLRQSGATVTQLSGCCGLAGNFGMERGHYETSVAVAELQLLPALRAAGEGSVFLADGFSCRTQADQLADVSALTLAQLFASRIGAAREAD